MNIKEIKIVYVTVYILLVALLLYPSVEGFIEREQDRFISMMVLDENELMQDYYPNGNFVNIGDELRWYIKIHNNMKESALIALKVKMVDLHTSSPDSNLFLPAQGEEVYILYQIVLPSEDLMIPFFWKISEVDDTGQLHSINKMVINQANINLGLILGGEPSGKIIFEVWSYNAATDEFQFKIETGVDQVCVWTQLQFTYKP